MRKIRGENVNKSIYFILFIFFVLMLTGCEKKDIRDINDIKARGKITMVTNAIFPPFEYYKFDKIDGIDIDIAREIAKDLGVELEIIDMNFDGMIAAIASGKGDFIASGLTVDEKRKRAISFSENYIEVPQSLIVKKENKEKEDLEMLIDKKIGVQIGTTSDKYVKEEMENGFLKDTQSTLLEKKEYLDLVIDLRNNRIDIIALDGLIARKLIENNEDLKYFDRDIESYALAVKKGNNTVLEAINNTIKKLKSNNKIKEFYDNHN